MATGVEEEESKSAGGESGPKPEWGPNWNGKERRMVCVGEEDGRKQFAREFRQPVPPTDDGRPSNVAQEPLGVPSQILSEEVSDSMNAMLDTIDANVKAANELLLQKLATLADSDRKAMKRGATQPNGSRSTSPPKGKKVKRALTLPDAMGNPHAL